MDYKQIGILLILFVLIHSVSATSIPISDCNELQNINLNLDGNYVLVKDINCSGFDFGDGLGFKPIGFNSSTWFRGILDGQGFAISNLYINRPSNDLVGLFGYLRGNSNGLTPTIKNLGLIDSNIIGKTYVGGIVGQALNTGIYQTYVNGEIRGTSYVGGIAGYINSTIISNSYASGKIIGTSGYYNGGILGYMEAHSSIYNSYSVAEILSVGGGLIGAKANNYSAVVSNSFYDLNISGKSDVGKGIPKTTEEMKNISIYLNNWNLKDVWGFIEGEYPRLRWQKNIDFSNAYDENSDLKLDIVIVADTSGSMNTVWSTLCTKFSEFKNALIGNEYDFRVTFYGMYNAGANGNYCSDIVINQHQIYKYSLQGLMQDTSQDWPSNGDIVVRDHDWREDASAKIMFLVGDGDGVASGSSAYTPRCNRLVQSALEKNVIVNTLMRYWSDNTIGASNIITTGTGGKGSLYGATDLLDLVQEIIEDQVHYFPEGLEDVGQCQRGIERLQPDGNWIVIREPVFASQEDNNYFACHDGIDNDCDGFTDSADLNCTFAISDVNFSPSVPMTMQDINIYFNVTNVNGGQVTCAIKETGVSQTLTGTNPLFNLNLGAFGSGSYLFGLFCSNGSLFEEKVYPFEVSALPDLSIDAIMSNSNPEVGDDLEITSEIRNNGGINFSNVPIELVYTDMNGDTIERELQNIDVGRNSSEVIVFHKVISTAGWKILEINIDPANIIEEEYESNNTSGKLIYGGLFDPSNSSAKINIESIVYPDKRPITGPGFLFVGKATYMLDGNNTTYPVAGAQIDITIDSNITTDASPLAELRDWTQSDGNFVIPFENPRVLADYSALIEITDGTAYGFSMENFVVDQNSIFIDYNTPWGDWNYGGNGFSGGGGSGGSGGDGGIGGGSGGGIGADCNKSNLTSSISVNYPNIDFSIGGYDAHGSEESIANKSYNIVITLNNTAISLSRTGVQNEIVYSGIINENLLPQLASIYIDSGNDINECNEYDNYSRVDLKGPNIKAKSIDAVSVNRKKLLQGEVTRFTLVMENTGSSVLNNVPVTFSVDNNVIRSYVISSIAPGQKNTHIFDTVLSNYGLTRFTLDSTFVDSDMNDNRFSKLFKVLIPDYYVRSFEDGPLIIVNPIYPTVGQNVDINATVKSNDRISKDASVPVELFADGAKISTSSVLFPNGKNFAFAQIDDYVAPMLAKTVSMGIYINRALRQYEENSMNNYVTFSLFVKSNPLTDANVSLLRYVDLNSLTPVVDKVLNTKFSNESDVLGQIKTFINNSANLSADTNGVYRIRVDVNGLNYYSNYFMVGNLNPVCESVTVPVCEEGMELVESVGDNNCPIMICEYDYLDIVFDFNGEWVEEEYPLNFYWSHALQDLNYYVALDLWTTNNSSPLGDIEDTIQRLKEDYAWSEDLPMHVYDYSQDFGELFYGGYMPKPFVFRVSAYLLDENFDLVGLIDEEEIVLKDVDPVCGDDIVSVHCSSGFIETPSFDDNNCPIIICTPIPIITDCWDENVSPHPICTIEDLNRVRTHLDWDYVLLNDINASETRNWDNGAGFEPISNYRGGFNGGGFVVSGLYIYRPAVNGVGLFGSSTLGSISKLGLLNYDITGGKAVGGLVGYNSSQVSKVYSKGIVKGMDPVGGSVGGIVGSNNGVVLESYSEGVVLGVDSLVGGISYPSYVGGLVGLNYYGSVVDCYSLADVNGPRAVGGLVGANHDVGGRAFVSNSYSAGVVNSFGLNSSPGGLMGSGGGLNVTDSYWDTQTSGLEVSGGGTGKTTLEMKDISTFVDWDKDIWSIVQGEYPLFNWQLEN